MVLTFEYLMIKIGFLILLSILVWLMGISGLIGYGILIVSFYAKYFA